MKHILGYLLIAGILASCSHHYYVVRHAEKAAQGPNMTSDVPLTDAGQQRANAIRDILRHKKIGAVYSTNTIRTRSTAQPTADYFGVPVTIYQPPVPSAEFIQQLKGMKKNVLVVGHSNTVDDLVNGLTGAKSVAGDLADSEYNHLFVVTVRGKRITFQDLPILPQQ